MPLESATYIDDLNVNNPTGTDARSAGDDHIRMIKQVLKNSFPSLSSPLTFEGRFLESAGSFASETIPATTKTVQTGGYATLGDNGHGQYVRVASEPSHEGKKRSVDRFLPDETEDLTNGGWWELVPTESVFHARQFGVVADGSTDDTAALQNAVTSTPAHHTLIIPANTTTNGVILLTTSDVHLHYEGLILVGDTGTDATTVSGSTGKVGFHYKEADRLKLTGGPRFVGQGTLGTTELAHEVFDNCDEVQADYLPFYRTCAAGRFIIQCDRSHFGGAVGRNIDGQQTFGSGTAGTLEVIIGCQYGRSGDIVVYDCDKPGRYYSVDSNQRQTKSFHCGATIYEGLTGTTEAHGVAIRNGIDCNIGPIMVDGTNISACWVNSYPTDTVEIDRIHIESILGKGATTGMSVDTLLKVGGSGDPIGRVTVGSVNGAADGEFGILVNHGSVHIGTACLTGAATRLVAVYGDVAGEEARLHIGSLEIYDNSGSTPVTFGKNCHLSIGTIHALTGPASNLTGMTQYNASLGTGSAGTYDIDTIRYRQNGSAGNYTFVFLDAENGFEQGRIGHIDGTGSSAQAIFDTDQVSIQYGRVLDTQAPLGATASYSKGAVVWNSNPSVASDGTIISHWICVTAGTPGTWQEIRQAAQPVLRGSGSPEGSVTADTGTIYTRTSADNMDVLYIKMSGSGNTGWIPMMPRRTNSAAPTTGTWVQGDMVWDEAPVAGGRIGWVCVTGGTPGTWKSWGVISS